MDTESTLLPSTPGDDVTLLPQGSPPHGDDAPTGAAPKAGESESISWDLTQSNPKGADATFWPEWKRDQKVGGEAEAWAAGLRGGEDPASSDPMVFGKPRHKERGRRPSTGDTDAASKEAKKGGEELVFSNPCFRKEPHRSASKPAARPPRNAGSPPKPQRGASPLRRGMSPHPSPQLGRPGSRARRSASQPPDAAAPALEAASAASEASPARAARAQSVGPAVKVGKDKEGGRQMFDKNELRSMHKALFEAAIEKRRSELLAQAAGKEEETEGTRAVVQVYLRKRPISEKEQKVRGDYDAVTVIPGKPCSKEVVLHNCQFQADLKTPFISHVRFGFDTVFPEDCSNDDVYAQTAEPLVQIALSGGMSTMFMFGQTGSGKTFTMTAIEEFAARDLFAQERSEDFISLQFFELRGNRCFDLLSQAAAARDTRAAARGRAEPAPELRLRENKDGTYVADGALVMTPTSPEELCTWMRRAHACRATSATEANDVSSRSHAVCMLRFESGGQLLLIDCAGTERRKDAMYHSKERQQEGAEINASLHSLKECIRHFTSHGSVPSHIFRASSLTKILAESFRSRAARLAVVCTASPCASDTEHTLSTLRTGVSLCNGSEREEKQMIEGPRRQRVPHPKTWSPEAVRSWLEQLGPGFQDALDELPSNFTGQMLVRCTEARCVQLCRGHAARGADLFRLLHEEMKKAG